MSVGVRGEVVMCTYGRRCRRRGGGGLTFWRFGARHSALPRGSRVRGRDWLLDYVDKGEERGGEAWWRDRVDVYSVTTPATLLSRRRLGLHDETFELVRADTQLEIWRDDVAVLAREDCA